MRAALLLAAVGLVGCGSPRLGHPEEVDGKYDGTYGCTVPYFHSFTAQADVDCDMVRAQVELARILLTTDWSQQSGRTSYPWDPISGYSFIDEPPYSLPAGALVPKSAFADGTYSDVDVYQYSNSARIPCGGDQAYGCYTSVDHVISLATDNGSLVHEMLHHWQWTHGVVNTSGHPGWSGNGYYAAEAAFAAFYRAAGPRAVVHP